MKVGLSCIILFLLIVCNTSVPRAATKTTLKTSVREKQIVDKNKPVHAFTDKRCRKVINLMKKHAYDITYMPNRIVEDPFASTCVTIIGQPEFDYYGQYERGRHEKIIFDTRKSYTNSEIMNYILPYNAFKYFYTYYGGVEQEDAIFYTYSYENPT